MLPIIFIFLKNNFKNQKIYENQLTESKSIFYNLNSLD